MIIVDAQQGSPEWHAHRANHFNASEAPIMKGDSDYMTRTDLLNLRAGGTPQEVSDFLQSLYDNGHETEELARPHIEHDLGFELFRVVGVSEEHEKLSASYDGLDMDEADAFEHKLWNESLVAYIREHNDVPPKHHWQLDQQFAVNPKLKRIHFVVSDGTTDKRFVFVYLRNQDRIAELVASWDQFAKDLVGHVPTTRAAALVAAATGTLPAVVYMIDHSTMTLTSNLPVIIAATDALLELTKAPLETDQDFVDRKSLCKYLRETETNLKLKAEEVIGQVEDIASFSRGLKDLAEVVRVGALASEKLVEAEEKARKLKIKTDGQQELTEHMAALALRLGSRVRMPAMTADLDGVMKNKRTIASLEDAVSTEVARFKIQSSVIADSIQINLNCLDALAGNYMRLFNDLQQIVMKPKDDFELLVKFRVGEQKRIDEERLEQDREKIREEERKKLEDQTKAAAPAAMETPAPAPVQATTTTPGIVMTGGTVSVPMKAGAVAGVDTSNVVSIAPATRKGVSDDEIIDVVMTHFNVARNAAIERLRKIDFDAAIRRHAESF